MNKGKLIFLDGISGSGKDTQLKFLVNYIESKFRKKVHIFVEPSKFLGDFIRSYRNIPEKERDGYIETLLFTADRMIQLKKNIEPILEDENNIAINVRSYISSCVYQSRQLSHFYLIQDRVPLEIILELNQFYPRPDLAFVTICEPEIAVERIHKRTLETEKEINQDETLEKIKRLKSDYESIISYISNSHLIRTDGSVEAVNFQLRSHLNHLFGLEMNKAVFLDKDGTLVDNSGYPDVIPSDQIYESTFDGLKILSNAGYKLIIVSNQPWIAKGRISKEQAIKNFESVVKQYQEKGIIIDKYYLCPHQSSDGCLCKKPGTKLLEQAIEDFNIDTTRSFIIGDVDRAGAKEINAGRNIGLKTILVKTGFGGNYSAVTTLPDYGANDLTEASRVIISNK